MKESAKVNPQIQEHHNMTSTIKWNGRTFIQYRSQDGDIVMIDTEEMIRDLDGTINEFLPEAPAHLNTADPAKACKCCNTAYRASDQRDPDRCPYCWRLI